MIKDNQNFNNKVEENNVFIEELRDKLQIILQAMFMMKMGIWLN